MRPLQLELTAFGPYPKHQAIDFTALGGSDLFLIHGPTGSGKTSIFDGLTYALFGDLAGSRRPDRIRADRADKDLQTRVVFRFRMGDAVYSVERTPEWERPKKRGGGTTTDPARATLVREGEAAAVATGASDVTRAVVAILGMDVNQFTQVALLPQGEFKRLLCADSKEREELLKRLFATDRYVDIENLLIGRHRKLETSYEKLKTQRAEVLGPLTAEELVARLTGVRADVVAAASRAEELRQKDLVALDLLAKARELSGRFDERDDATKAEAGTRAAAELAKADRKTLDRARSAERVRDRLDRAQQAEAESALRVRNEEEAAEAEQGSKERHAKAEASARAAEAETPEMRRIERRVSELDRALPDLQRLSQLDALLADEKRKAADARGKQEKAGKSVEGAEAQIAALTVERTGAGPLAAEVPARQDVARSLDEALRAAREREKLRGEMSAQAKAQEEAIRTAKNSREAADLALKAAKKVHALREERLAAWLARTALNEGEACPVCGSIDHPAPAHADGHIPDEQEVATAQARGETLGRSAGEAESNLSLAKGRLDDLTRRLAEATTQEARPVGELHAAHTAATKALAEAKAAAERLATLDEQLGKARAALEAARKAHGETALAVTAAQEATVKTEASRAEIQQRLTAIGAGAEAADEIRKLRADLQSREKRARDARDEQQAAVAAAAQATTRLTLAVKAREEAARSLVEARASADAACTEEGFSGIAACREALLPVAQQGALDTSIQQRISAHLAEKKRLERVEAELSNLARPDVAALEAARAEAEKAARAADGEWVSLGAEENRLSGLVSRIAQLQGQSDQVTEELAVVGKVAELVRGHNPKGMSLHRFVLAARLEEVAEAASERLVLMTNGRFRLRHDTSLARKNAAAGLSLVVEDTHTGTLDRPVGALSGGESFLASLSLALGLSDVVLRHSGGRRLDALFVDEGFGTLDEATLDVAIQALETLPQAGRLVGVISHVAELRRRIPARIEVTSTEAGAVATVRPA